MIAHLIGGRKWVQLIEELNVYQEEKFGAEIAAVQKAYRRTADRIWVCLTRWRVKEGMRARVSDLISALRAVQVTWLAGRL